MEWHVARVRDRYGIHPRAALNIQQLVSGYRATVTLQGMEGEGPPLDCTSMIALVSGGIRPGEGVKITAFGDDEKAVVEALKRLIEGGICHP
jgi:phosphotransferase system HPr (HPr) family protein